MTPKTRISLLANTVVTLFLAKRDQESILRLITLDCIRKMPVKAHTSILTFIIKVQEHTYGLLMEQGTVSV